MTIKDAISNAKIGKSKLNNEVISTFEGLSCPPVWHLLNNIASMGKTYLEVGSFKGGTIQAAMYGNDLKSWAVDNFTLDYSTRQRFYNNTKHLENLTFIEKNCWTVDLREIEPIDVYFYDGPHSFEDHCKAISYFLPAMKDEFIYVCDDWNAKRVPNATITTALDMNLEIVEKWELFCNPDTKEWWNGIGVIKFRKK